MQFKEYGRFICVDMKLQGAKDMQIKLPIVIM